MQNDHNIASQQYGTVLFWRGPLQLKLLQASHLLNPALPTPLVLAVTYLS